MIKYYKIEIIPNNKQKTQLFKMAGVARFAYNWALNAEQKAYKDEKKFLSNYELCREFTQLKKQNNFLWLNDYSNNVSKQAIKDACKAYELFFNKKCKYPKFKTKKKSKPSFHVDTSKIKFSTTHIKLEKISKSKKSNKQKLNWVRLAEHNRIPINIKYYKPRIIYDGLKWWACVGIEKKENEEIQYNKGIGIDVGIKELAICSDGNIYKNINKTFKMRKLERRRNRVQQKISKKYLKNKKGKSYKKTKNIIKSEKQLLKLNRKLANIKENYLHQITTEIINRKPRFITIEDLNIKGIMKNKHLSKAIQEQCLYKFRNLLEYKCKFNNIELRVVDRFYPSSKKCNNCGNKKEDLKLNDRIYKCEKCGYEINRDYNASLNLRDSIEYKIV